MYIYIINTRIMASLLNSMVGPKVNPGNAARAFSARQQDIERENKIERTAVDQYGRPVDWATLITYRQGGTTCSDPRIALENSLSRPQYHAHMDMARGMSGGYDTMLGTTYLSRANAFRMGDDQLGTAFRGPPDTGEESDSVPNTGADDAGADDAGADDAGADDTGADDANTALVKMMNTTYKKSKTAEFAGNTTHGMH
jgi:hypothetical protein